MLHMEIIHIPFLLCCSFHILVHFWLVQFSSPGYATHVAQLETWDVNMMLTRECRGGAGAE